MRKFFWVFIGGAILHIGLGWFFTSVAQTDRAQGVQTDLQGITVEGSKILGEIPADERQMEVDAESREEDASDKSDESLKEARELYKAEKYDETIEILEVLLEEDPALSLAWELLGWSYWNVDRKEDTLRLWKRLKTIAPESAAPYRLLGKYYIANDKLQKALENFKKSLEIEPDQPALAGAMGSIYRWLGRFDKAIPILRRQYEQDPDNTKVAIELAKALVSSAQYEEAIPIWDEIAEEGVENADIKANYANALLKANRKDQAVAQARTVLEEDDDNRTALLVLADAAQYSGNLEKAAPYLERALDATERRDARIRLVERMIILYRDIWEADPGANSLDRSIELCRELLELRPDWVDTHLMLAELLMEDGQLNESEWHNKHVLEKYNPHNLRARRSLFEIYMEKKSFKRAEQQLKHIVAFNPRDPYNEYYRARLEFNRGRFREANAALDRLERAGAKGAVAVLLYHGFTSTDYRSVLSTDLLASQLQAMQNAGFRFVSVPEIPMVFTGHRPPLGELEDYSPPLVACVTDDDARRDAFEEGTQVAKVLGIPISMHVPPPYLDGSESFFINWDELKEYAEMDEWVIGSHLQNASDMGRINEAGTRCYPLPNRLWLPEKDRRENRLEYFERVENEYKESKDELKRHLGEDYEIEFVAYPYGDIGQETCSNVDEAIPLNLEMAGRHYEIGFIQTQFGYAVNGDNPLLYQRHEPKWFDSPEDVLEQFFENHPVYLARRLRAEFAALRGRLYEARRMLQLLERDNYPESSLQRVERYVNDKLSMRFNVDADMDTPTAKASRFRLRNPFVGLNAEHIDTSIDQENTRLTLDGGVELTPNISVEGFAGRGTLKQKYTESPGTAEAREVDVDVDETTVGGRVGVIWVPDDKLMSPVRFSGELGRRDYSGDADHSEMLYSGQVALRPRPPLDLRLSYTHDALPWARSLQEEKSYDLLDGIAEYRLRDWWNIRGATQMYDFSDDNSRDHYTVGSMWEIIRYLGLHGGLRYSYSDSEQEREDYWTPYELQRFYASLSLQRQAFNWEYELSISPGIGKEDVRPSEIEEYEQTLARAQRENWTLLPERPESDGWEAVFEASASVSTSYTEHWEIGGQISYIKVPDYTETRISGRLQYAF